MEAEINVSNKIPFNGIIVGGKPLSDIFQEISELAHRGIYNISIERQSDYPDLYFINSELNAILNIIEHLQI